MSDITLTDLDPATEANLRRRAERHGRSLEDEIKAALAALTGGPAVPGNLADAIRAVVEPIGGIEFELPPREPYEPFALGGGGGGLGSMIAARFDVLGGVDLEPFPFTGLREPPDFSAPEFSAWDGERDDRPGHERHLGDDETA